MRSELQPDRAAIRRLADILRDGGSLTLVSNSLKFYQVHPSLRHYFRAPRPLLQTINPDLPPYHRPAVALDDFPWLGGLLYCDRLSLVLDEHRQGRVGQAAAPADALIYLLSTPAGQPSIWQPLLPAAGYLTVQRQPWLDRAQRQLLGRWLGGSPTPPTADERLALLRLQQRLRIWLLRLERQRLLSGISSPLPDRPTGFAASFRAAATGRSRMEGR